MVTARLTGKVGILSISFTHRADWNRLMGEADGSDFTGKTAQTKKTFKVFGNLEGLNLSTRVMRI